jgi:dolichol-phosphate mannosyltransferase
MTIEAAAMSGSAAGGEGEVLPSASLVIPMYNESASAEVVLRRVLAYIHSSAATLGALEILVVDDGSADDTAAIVERVAADAPEVRLIRHGVNRGLEAALRTGYAASRAGRIVVLDADLSYAPEITVAPLLSALESTGALMVLASPYMPGGKVGNVPPVRLAASRGANALLSLCVGGRIKTFTGMVRGFDRTTLLGILDGRESFGEFNAWLVAMYLSEGKPVVEVPAALVWPEERRKGVSRMTWAQFSRRARGVLKIARLLARSKTRR